MKDEQIAQLRHDLLTPINHILGLTEIQIEDAQENEVSEYIPALNGINHGGRTLLRVIEEELREEELAPESDLHRLSTRVAAEADPALDVARTLAVRLRSEGRDSVADDVELIQSALESLLSLCHAAAGPHPAKK